MQKMPLLLFTSILLLSIVASIAVTTAQDTVYPLLTLSSNQLAFYAKENGATQSVDFTLVGLTAGEGVNVKIVSSKLYDNASGKSINILSISEDDFNLKQNENKTVTLTLNPSGSKPGTYEGALIITATNKTATSQILTTHIKVTAKIESTAFWYEPYVQIIFIVGAIAPIFIGLAIPDKEVPRYKYSKKFWLVVLGAVSVSFWLVSIVTLSFKEPGTIINTVLVTPFLTYVVSFVKDKRTERLEREKTSRSIRDDGIKEDIKLIRNLIGEMSTHCASFVPNYYAEKINRLQPERHVSPDYTPRLLYSKAGLIDRKVWDESCRQGFVADIPTLHLENYYDFIPLYNKYYTEAMTRAKEIASANEEFKIDEPTFFAPFEKFRKKYGELQRVLFVYLTYILELYSKTTLTPMKVEYPRITRTLLYKLIEYRILIPWDFIGGFGKKELKDFGKKKILEELKKDSSLKENYFVGLSEGLIETFKKKQKQKASWLKEFREEHPQLKEDSSEFKTGFDQWQINHFRKGTPDKDENSKEFQTWKKENIDDVTAIEIWLTRFFENRIERWDFTADDLNRIEEYIYAEDRVPHFLRHVQDDFQETYLELKDAIKALPDAPEIPKESETKEYRVNLGNVYKEDKETKLKPDPLRFVLNNAANKDTKEKPPDSK